MKLISVRERTDRGTYTTRDVQTANRNKHIDKEQKIQLCTPRGRVSHHQLSALPRASEVTPDPATGILPPRKSVFCVGVSACKPSCAAGQLMEKRKKGQEGSVVARCGVGQHSLNNEEWEAQEEEKEEQEDEEERSQSWMRRRRNILGLKRCV